MQVIQPGKTSNKSKSQNEKESRKCFFFFSFPAFVVKKDISKNKATTDDEWQATMPQTRNKGQVTATVQSKC